MEDTTMKKTYINPNTEVHEIELAQMIAESMNVHNDTKKGFGASLSNEGEMTETSGSVWGEEE